ncbi:hypothetical protein KTO58_17275 [Chitinophaga pendula]|uniref:hypothetical protein n=1 Tax=Chitinophaga TaxID=79328 RepID=UPI000BAEB313|nr:MULTISPECIES: hypothetical protein [Chitinophaga]ASZ11548.1 hypothetical protein CK934_11565 [Chitinophaga sp. MD30]UCJ05442.1 hypothetical protein KTO58_17275 [Chitinophaga pendula]
MQYKTPFLLLASFFILEKSYCQFDEGIVKAGNKTYQCKLIDSNRLYISNSENILGSKQPQIPAGVEDLTSIECKGVNEVGELIRGVIPKDKLQKIADEKAMVITYSIDNTGKVLETTFAIDANTQIAPMELSKLEDKIKTVTFTFKNDQLKGVNFIRFNSMFPLRRVLNKEKLCGMN